VLAAEVGHLELAYAYAVEAALMDLDDLEHNTRDGLHLASLAGAWIALVGGFGGMRDSTPILRFAPRLPRNIRRLRFIVTRHGHPLRVTVTPEQATYQLQDGDGLTIEHHGEQIQLEPDVLVRRPIPPLPQESEQSTPRQPAGRAPLRPDGDAWSQQDRPQDGVDHGGDQRGGGDGQHPGGGDVAGDTPAHR
jgi:alpha,alpha-trehalose phosphorylase